MEKVQVADKVFEIFLSQEEIKQKVHELARELEKEYKDKDLVVISVLKGAYIFTSDLIREVDMDPEIHFIQVSSYGGGMTSRGKVRELKGLNATVKDRHVLIVEDICDLGHTLDWLHDRFGIEEPASLKTVVFLFKEDAFEGDHRPDFVGFSIPNDFVVGYGLDYQEKGRHLPAIYKLAE